MWLDATSQLITVLIGSLLICTCLSMCLTVDFFFSFRVFVLSYFLSVCNKHEIWISYDYPLESRCFMQQREKIIVRTYIVKFFHFELKPNTWLWKLIKMKMWLFMLLIERQVNRKFLQIKWSKICFSVLSHILFTQSQLQLHSCAGFQKIDVFYHSLNSNNYTSNM